MKHFITPLLVAAISTSAWAGGVAEHRNHCRTFSKRYVSSARISSFVLLCYQTNRSCNGVIYGYGHPSCSKNCGFQEAWSGPQGLGTNGQIYQRICSRGEGMDDLTLELMSGGTTAATAAGKSIEESKLQCEPVKFDDASHSIVIQKLDGQLYLGKNNGFTSTMKLTVWMPNDSTGETEDTVVDANEVVESFVLAATDQGIKFSGSLAAKLAKQVTVKNSTTDVTAALNIGQLIIPIPASIPLESLAVRLETDGAPERGDRQEAAMRSTQAAIEARDVVLNVFPNPATDQVQVQFANNQASGQTTIQLFDGTGRKVKEVFSAPLEQRQLQHISIDLAGQPAGTYFLLINSGSQQLLQQIVKQ